MQRKGRPEEASRLRQRRHASWLLLIALANSAADDVTRNFLAIGLSGGIRNGGTESQTTTCAMLSRANWLRGIKARQRIEAILEPCLGDHR